MGSCIPNLWELGSCLESLRKLSHFLQSQGQGIYLFGVMCRVYGFLFHTGGEVFCGSRLCGSSAVCKFMLLVSRCKEFSRSASFIILSSILRITVPGSFLFFVPESVVYHVARNRNCNLNFSMVKFISFIFKLYFLICNVRNSFLLQSHTYTFLFCFKSFNV